MSVCAVGSGLKGVRGRGKPRSHNNLWGVLQGGTGLSEAEVDANQKAQGSTRIRRRHARALHVSGFDIPSKPDDFFYLF